MPRSARLPLALTVLRRLGSGALLTLAALSQQAGCDDEGCVTAGCSGVSCVDESERDMATTCEYAAEYDCYKSTRPPCERQSDGQCGYTTTSALQQCLDAIKARRGKPCDDATPCPEGLSCSNWPSGQGDRTCQG